MTTVEELDFRLIFGEDLARQPLDEAVLPGPNAAAGQDGCEVRTFDHFYSLISQPVSQDLQQGQHATPALLPNPNNYPHPGYDGVQGSQYASVGNLRSFDCPSIQITNTHPDTGSCQDAKASGGAEGQGTEQHTWSRDNLYLSLDPYYRDANLNPSPGSSLSSRSWLSDISSCESFSHVYDDVDGELNEAAARVTLGSPRGTTPSPLPSPGCGGGAFGVEIWQQQYQHNLAFTQALSPHQSPRQSPCPSPRHSPRNSVTDENWLNPRPTSRSNSRPTSPCGKRRHSSADGRARSPSPHHSPSPTPGHSPRNSVTEDSWIGSPTLGPVLYGCYPELDVPSKTRRTTGTQLAALCGQGEELGASLPFLDSPGGGGGEERVQQDAGLAELFLPVPSFSWNKPTPGTTPLFRSLSLPPLDWPLPSQYGPCELKIEVQPRAHHRAHYETEGSRGSVKAVSGGHPVVKLNGYSAQPVNLQVFIGTADERYLRPHAFYQVHRVTGKTVSTLCLEKTVGITKVLEIPLLPENGMTTSIDCAGILKLRNSDIELRKGETDIGRKNTRARVVFRVYIPQPDGKALCLQAASVPIECSQRSALELPQVDGFSPASCAVDGGPEMVITGSNLSPESRVIFVEKGPDGRTQWEVDVKAIPDKSSGCSIVVEIPPYHNNKTTATAQVHFYVSNGKRKRSLTQSFTYLAGATAAAFCFVPTGGRGTAGAPLIKQERCDLDYTPAHNPPGVYSTTAAQLPSPDRAFCPDRPFYDYAAPPQAAYSPARSSPLRHPSHLQHGFGPDVAGQPRINAMQILDLGLASQTIPSSQTVPYSHQPSSLVRSAVVLAARSEHHSGPLRPDQHTHHHHHHHPAPVRSITSHPTAHLPSTGRGEPLSASQATSLHLSAPQTKASSQKPQASSPGAPRRALLLSCVDPQKQHVSAPHSLFSSSGDAVSIKQEPDELPQQTCMGLQEITLDDVNEIIDRDIFQLSSGDDMVLGAQDPYGWDQNSADTALQYCGSLQ